MLIEEGRIKAAFNSGVFVLKLCGDVRLTLCATLDTQAQRLAETPGLQAVMIDLREATNVDSTALGFLAKVAMAVKGRLEQPPTIIADNPDVRQMLDVPSGEEGSCKEEEWREFGLWFRHNRSEIVSSAYLQEQLEFIVEFVKRCIDVPTSVEDLFQQCNDAYCRDGNNSGSLEMDQVLRAFSSCEGLGELRSGNNIFFPFVFSLKQRREVDDLFRLNGYITKFQACVQYHLSEAAIESLVQK